MGTPFKKYAWGDLNPIEMPASGDRMDSERSDFLRAANVIHTKAYTADLFKNTGPYLAMVLRIEAGAPEPNNFADISLVEAGQSVRVQIKARIPEVHAPVMEPAHSDDHNIIDMHPTFTAKDNNVPEPKIGELVWVDYQNKQNWTGPIYLGPVIAPPLSLLAAAAAAGAISAKQGAEKCIKGCLSYGKGGGAPIDVSTFPIAKGSLVPKTGNNRCLVFGDSQITGYFGKTLAAYLKSAGWKTKRVHRSGARVDPWLSADASKCKTSPLGKAELWGCIAKYITKHKPALIVLSMGGNNKSDEWPAKAAPDMVKLIQKIRKAAGWTNPTQSGAIIVCGCPPVIPGGSYTNEDLHQINNPGKFAYRTKINKDYQKSLSSQWGYGKTLYYIDPIADWKKYLPKYMARKTEHDGLHLDEKGATEYVTNFAIRFGAKARAVKPGQGKEIPAPAENNKAPGANADKTDTEDNKKELREKDKEVFKKEGASGTNNSNAEDQQRLAAAHKQRTEIQEKIKAAGENPPDDLKSQLSKVQETIKELESKLNKSKPASCVPCKTYKHAAVLKGALNSAVKRNGAGPPIGFMYYASGVKGDAINPEYIKNFGFVCAKSGCGEMKFEKNYRGAKSFAEHCAIIKNLSVKANVPLHTWAYSYCTSYEQAAREGALMAQRALKLGSKLHWVNAEKQWLGTSGSPFYPDVVGRMAEFVRAFRAIAPGIPLANTCMSKWSSGVLKVRAKELNQMFDLYAPMVYATSAKTYKKKHKIHYKESRKCSRGFAPVIGSGRIDPKTKAVWGDQASVIQLQKSNPASMICVWMGPGGAIDTVAKGNKSNISWIEVVKKLKA